MRKSTFRAIIAILLVAVFLIGGWLIGWKVTGEINPSQWGKPKDENGGQTNVIITEGGSHGVALMCAEIPVKDFAAYDLDEEETESAFTLKLEVTPETAVVTNFTWSVEFVNANSEWASGKEINDYYTITPAEDNKSAVAACKQAFGEQIRIKAVYNGDSTIFATKMADYVKRVIKYNLYGSGVNASWYAEIYDMNTPDGDDTNFNPINGDGSNWFDYGVGTIGGGFDYKNYSLTGHLELSEEAYNYLLSADSSAHKYMSQFFAANSGVELSRVTPTQTYDANYGDETYNWFDQPTCVSFLNKPFNELKNLNYYYAAFKEMLENTTNQTRLVLNTTYRSKSYIEPLELKTDWQTNPASYIVLINDINISGGDLLH